MVLRGIRTIIIIRGGSNDVRGTVQGGTYA